MTSSDNIAMDGHDGPRRPAPSPSFPVVPFFIMAVLVVLAFVAGRASAPEKQPAGHGGLVTVDDPKAKDAAERLLAAVENKPEAQKWTLGQERELRAQRSKLTKKTRAEISERLARLVNAQKLKRVYPPGSSEPTWCPPPWGDLPECHKKEPPKEPPAGAKAQ